MSSERFRPVEYYHPHSREGLDAELSLLRTIQMGQAQAMEEAGIITKTEDILASRIPHFFGDDVPEGFGQMESVSYAACLASPNNYYEDLPVAAVRARTAWRNIADEL